MKKIGMLLFILVLIISCKSKKIEQIKDANMPYLTLTSGGGFAGTYTTYVLLENGQIFNIKSDLNSATPVGEMPKDETAQIFSNYKVLDLDNVEEVSYGNYTYSIIKTEGDKSHKMVWGKDKEGAEILQVFYKNAMNAIKKNKDEFNPGVETKKQ